MGARLPVRMFDPFHGKWAFKDLNERRFRSTNASQGNIVVPVVFDAFTHATCRAGYFLNPVKIFVDFAGIHYT